MRLEEKDNSLPLSEKRADFGKTNKERSTPLTRLWIAAVALALLFLIGPVRLIREMRAMAPSAVYTASKVCPLLEKLKPGRDSDLSDVTFFHTDSYRKKSIRLWSDAVRIPTSNFDDLADVRIDPRWNVFYNFSAFLVESFPAVAAAARIEKINVHGLVFTLEGSNGNLQPLILAGHQDVVPVPDETASRWTYPPFEGFFDGEFLWGRGASDCKNNVIGIFEALEALLVKGFKPRRTIIIALGFDEETGGAQGAAKLGQYLLSKLGSKSVFMLVDEGGLGVQERYGSRFALPSTGEKGSADVVIELDAIGGHSSVPPRHTAIGIAAELITDIEKDEYPLNVLPESPYFHQLQCEARWSKHMDRTLRSNILKLQLDPKAKKNAIEALSRDITSKVLMSTTQAIDIVHGGFKINALPEKVTIQINHRISYEHSLDKLKKRLQDVVSKIADKYSLDVEAFGTSVKEKKHSVGKFTVYTSLELSPAPMTTTVENPSWDLLAGSIRFVFEDFAEYSSSVESIDPEVFVSPSCMTGNTDTRYYWNLTDNIYRFTPIRQDQRLNPHAVDERVSLTGHIEGVAFFYTLIQNVDEYDGN